jgi:lipid-binding SYLF domain-containing protein
VPADVLKHDWSLGERKRGTTRRVLSVYCRHTLVRGGKPMLLSCSRRAALGVVLSTWSAVLPAALIAQSQPDAKLADRARRAGEIVAELVREPDHAPPQSLLNKAICMAAVPRVVQAGLEIGGKVGFGLASCRTPTGWSLPTFIALKGGTFGLQIGVQASDVVLVFLNRDAPNIIGSTSFDLGGQASVAAGPVGRNLSAETDYKLTAEIYSYSRSKGLFAGINLAGTKWEIDSKANLAVYGETRAGDVSGLLRTDGTGGPALVQPFLDSLRSNVGTTKP